MDGDYRRDPADMEPVCLECLNDLEWDEETGEWACPLAGSHDTLDAADGPVADWYDDEGEG